MGLRPFVVIALLLPLAAACSRDATRMGMPGPGPGPLTPAPAGQVDRGELPPPGETDGMPRSGIADLPLDTGPEEPQVAALPDATESPSREDVLGQWSLSGPSDNCQMFVSLTSWEGGYRASTRGCSSPELTSIGAWDIDGDLVVLKDNEGNPLGRLARTGPARYDGRLDLGGGLAMSR